jgi:ribosomal protein L12E/L44/L45/RPP1/RPP2
MSCTSFRGRALPMGKCAYTTTGTCGCVVQSEEQEAQQQNEQTEEEDQTEDQTEEEDQTEDLKKVWRPVVVAQRLRLGCVR